MGLCPTTTSGINVPLTVYTYSSQYTVSKSHCRYRGNDVTTNIMSALNSTSDISFIVLCGFSMCIAKVFSLHLGNGYPDVLI